MQGGSLDGIIDQLTLDFLLGLGFRTLSKVSFKKELQRLMSKSPLSLARSILADARTTTQIDGRPQRSVLQSRSAHHIYSWHISVKIEFPTTQPLSTFLSTVSGSNNPHIWLSGRNALVNLVDDCHTPVFGFDRHISG